MNGKLIECLKVDNIILKKPHKVGDGRFVSEIWYMDEEHGSNPIKPIIKTPRLKVKYGAKQFKNTNSYSYCLSMYNRDIDPDIGSFYQLFRDYDSHIMKIYMRDKKEWENVPTPSLKYWTSLKRKNKLDEFHLQLKLICDKDGSVLTAINDSSRNECLPDDIKYGCYCDQYISPTLIYYDEQGIHPVWQTHQVVVSNVDRVFLEKCLLDDIYGAPMRESVPYYRMGCDPSSMPIPPPPPPFSTHQHQLHQQQQQQQHQPHQPSKNASPLAAIKAGDIQKALGSLRKTKTKTNAKSNLKSTTLALSAQKLQSRKDEIDKKAQRNLIISSVNSMTEKTD